MIDVLGCPIHVVERGQGPTILFIHGNPDSSRMWDPIIDVLAVSYRCIALDLPGYGASDVPDGFDYTLPAQAEFLEMASVAMGLSAPVHVVGHDFGGICAAAWMALYPQRFRSFVVINSAFSARYLWHFWAHVWRTPWLGEFSMRTMTRAVFGLGLRRGSHRLPNAHIDATYALLSPTVKRTMLRHYRAVDSASFAGWEERYQQSAGRVPVLALWGEGDPYIPSDMADTFHPRRIVRFADAGHWLPVVEPRAVSNEISAFLAHGDAAAR